MTLMEALRAIHQEVRLVRVDNDGKIGCVTAPMPEGQITVNFDSDGSTDSYAVDGKVVRLVRAISGVGTVSKRGEKLRISSGNGNYSFSLVAADSVPVVAEPKSWTAIPVSPKTLYGALAFVRTAAATDDIRFYLNGVLIQVADQLQTVASNGHVAAIASNKIEPPCAPVSVILPNKCVSEIVRLLASHSETDVAIETGERESGTTMLRIRSGHVTYVAIGIEGKYPEVDRVFAANAATSFARFEADAVSEAVKRLELTVQAKNPSIVLTLGDGNLKLSSSADPDKGGAETVAATEAFTGQLECGINPYYLADAIDATTTQAKSVSLGWLAPEKAITIQPATEDGVSTTKKWIVMPLRA